MAGKITMDLLSHWPCVTDLYGLSTNRFDGLREMGTAKGGLVEFTFAWSALPLPLPLFTEFFAQLSYVLVSFEQ